MNRNLTLPETNYLRTAACILLMFSTGCTPKTDDSLSMQFSADTAENSHLKHVFFSRNKDSICKYAEADYTRQKCYVFWAGMPGELRFNNYLAAYAKEKYNLILIGCGCKNRPGPYYYNNQMDVFLLKANKKPMNEIYLEAKY